MWFGTYKKGCCRETNPCDVNEGYCNDDDGCKGDLICGSKNCGIAEKIADCCMKNPVGETYLLSKYKKYFIFDKIDFTRIEFEAYSKFSLQLQL